MTSDKRLDERKGRENTLMTDCCDRDVSVAVFYLFQLFFQLIIESRWICYFRKVENRRSMHICKMIKKYFTPTRSQYTSKEILKWLWVIWNGNWLQASLNVLLGNKCCPQPDFRMSHPHRIRCNTRLHLWYHLWQLVAGKLDAIDEEIKDAYMSCQG